MTDIFILKAILLAISCSATLIFIYLFIIFFRKGRTPGEPKILELQRQIRLIFIIWFFGLLMLSGLILRPTPRIDALLYRLGPNLALIGFIYGVFFYFLLVFIYVTLYYLIDRSVSATLLEIIYISPQKKLNRDEIVKIYNPQKKYERELNGMLEGNFIRKLGDDYINCPKGLYYARFIGLMKSWLKLGPGG